MKKLFTVGWKFYESEYGVDYEKALSRKNDFADVKIPHDYMINDPKNLYRDSNGWYMKSFDISKEQTEKELYLVFDGIYMDSVVYINGKAIGEWKYGYSKFTLRITDFVKEGINEIVVVTRYKFPNTRWYSGAGIYRNIYFCEYDKTYIPEDGIYVHLQKENGLYRITAVTEIIGDEADKDVEFALFDAMGRKITLEETETDDFTKDALLRYEKDKNSEICVKSFMIKDVSEWDVENPVLYSLKARLKDKEETIQEEIISIGFKDVRMDPDKGFFLNGKHLKLNGVCIHHDLGALGSAYNNIAMRRRLIQFKEMGVNAIRLTHNMFAPEVTALADEMGFMLISEAFDMWERPKTEFDYARFFPEWHSKDVASWIRRDRNHVSVILWSIGNEIYDTHADERGQEVTRDLKNLVEIHDPFKNARATIGSNYMPWENAQKCADILTIAGYNYAENIYEQHHMDHPERIIYGSETYSIVQSRGIYHFPLSVPILSETDEQCSSLGNSTTSWGAESLEKCICMDRDIEFSLGQFIWTGYDYIGEPTPYQTKNSYFGLIDTAGFYKDAYYAWKSAWVDSDKDAFVHVFPYWDFNEGQVIDVRVVSNCPEVELFVNGKSLGRQCLTHAPHSGYKIFADYALSYEKGGITAVAYDEKGQEVKRETRMSFGDTESFEVNIDRRLDGYIKDASGNLKEDALCFAEISALDSEGNPVENAMDYVSVSVTGGKLLGLDNGDSTDYDSYQSNIRKLFGGKLLAIIKPYGNIDDVKVEVEKTDFVPVRKIEMSVKEGSRVLNGSENSVLVTVKVLPENATDKSLVFKALTKKGTKSNIAEIEVTGNECRITALGDGDFILRCEASNGREVVAVMSSLEFKSEGLGTAFLDPYDFISASLYTSHSGRVGSGNDHGVATARDGVTVVSFAGIDFGVEGSDEITVPIFALSDDAYDIEIWKGIPLEEGSALLKSAVYRKKCIWNVYQEDTWKLSERLTGIQTISFKAYKKMHIKGFSFTRQLRAFYNINAGSADSVYGDAFEKKETCVEQIGNNVTLAFDELNFGDEGANSITVCGRARKANTIHLRFSRNSDKNTEIKEILEFPQTGEYTEVTFPIDLRKGLFDVSFVFLPGSDFDFKYFRFSK